MADQAGFIGEYRRKVMALLDVLAADLTALNTQYDALDYITEIPDGLLDAPHDDLTGEQFKAGVEAVKVIHAQLDGTVYETNLFRLVRFEW